VLVAYWDLARAEEDLDLRRRSVELIDEQVEITKDLIEAGTVAEIELDVLAQQRVAAEEGVLLAELARERAENELRRRAGLEQGRDTPRLSPDTTVAAVVVPDADRTDELVEQAQRRSYAVRALEERIAAQELQLEQAEAELDPVLDVFVNVAQQGLDDDIGIEDHLFFDAWKEVVFLEFGSVGAGVQFSIELDNQRASAEADAARVEIERLEAELARARADVESTVVSQMEAIESTRARLRLLERSVELAESNLRAGKERFAAGQITSLDVLRLQEELEDAETRREVARLELVDQTLQLEHVTGTLLERLGVSRSDVDPITLSAEP